MINGACSGAMAWRQAVPALALLWPAAARADAPLNYLRTFGPHANAATALLWGMLIISIAVIAIVTALLLAGLFRRREAVHHPLGPMFVERPPGGRSWIAIGTCVSTAVLFAVTVWTVLALAAIAWPPGGHAAGPRVEVIGHQWWWEIHYHDDDPSQTFATANEIHLPVGQAVHVTLKGVDVIHSFWVPALAGKTDVIPGQVNETWLEAQVPGVYFGQCTEYCGVQHAQMGLKVIADAPGDFDAWRRGQLESAPRPDEALRPGANAFAEKCSVCHAIRGTRAGGILGPDLSHLMTRTTLAAGTLPNAQGYLSAWIADPQHFKPGTLMPRIELSASELESITLYLRSLK